MYARHVASPPPDLIYVSNPTTEYLRGPRRLNLADGGGGGSSSGLKGGGRP